MPFVQGQSGNPSGRPTKEAQTLKSLPRSEVDAVLKKLRRASPAAVTLIIQAMSDESIPKKDKLRYAKEVFDMWMKAVALDNTLKKAAGADEAPEEEIVIPSPVFKIV